MELRFKEEIGSWNKIGFLNPHDLSSEYIATLPVRYGTRVIIVVGEDKIAIVNMKNKNLHTLIGGNIEDNENIEEGLLRECLEESGYTISEITVLGYIELWRKKYRRFVFGFIAKAIGTPAPLKLTEEEKESGHEVMLCSIEEAIDLLDADNDPSDNLTSIRSLMLLEEAKKHIKRL